MLNLKQLRLERNLSQQKLAEKFGITQQAIFNYENGITEPDIYMLTRLADFFHTSVDYIIGYTDNPLSANERNTILNLQNFSKEIHHLSLYQELEPPIQEHIDSLMEELVKQKHTNNS